MWRILVTVIVEVISSDLNKPLMEVKLPMTCLSVGWSVCHNIPDRGKFHFYAPIRELELELTNLVTYFAMIIRIKLDVKGL